MKADNIEWKDRLLISENAHLILKGHLAIEKIFEEKLNIGTTKKGIGVGYATKFLRFGLRVGDLLDSNFDAKYKQFY